MKKKLVLLVCVAALGDAAGLERADRALRRPPRLSAGCRRARVSGLGVVVAAHERERSGLGVVVAAHERERAYDSRPLGRSLRLRGGMSVQAGWATLCLAILFELSFTAAMHKSQGFSRPTFAFLAVLFFVASFSTFNFSLSALEMSVAYAVWSAGVMATLSLVGILMFNEKATISKLCGISSIIFGTICLSRDLSE